MRPLLPIGTAALGVLFLVVGLTCLFGPWALVGTGAALAAVGLFAIDDGRPQ